SRQASELFPVFVPLAYLSRIRPGDPSDPLLLQVLPLAAEDTEAIGFTADPLAEATALAAPGLLQKYARRALLITTGACAIHCRYCFRREYPYQTAGPPAWGKAIERLAQDSSVEEVLLSGGDPLTLGDSL